MRNGSWDAGMPFISSGEKVDLESNDALAIEKSNGRALEPSSCLVALSGLSLLLHYERLYTHMMQPCWRCNDFIHAEKGF